MNQVLEPWFVRALEYSMIGDELIQKDTKNKLGSRERKLESAAHREFPRWVENECGARLNDLDICIRNYNEQRHKQRPGSGYGSSWANVCSSYVRKLWRCMGATWCPAQTKQYLKLCSSINWSFAKECVDLHHDINSCVERNLWNNEVEEKDWASQLKTLYGLLDVLASAAVQEIHNRRNPNAPTENS